MVAGLGSSEELAGVPAENLACRGVGLHRRLLHGLASITILIAGSGCTSLRLPSLEGAVLVEVRPGSAEDRVRLDRAEQQHRREMFRGISFAPKGGQMVTFGKDEYDQYLAYMRANASLDVSPRAGTFEWPLLTLSFRSDHSLFEEKSNAFESVAFFSCGDQRRLPYLQVQTPGLMWRDRAITPGVAMKIEDLLLSKAGPQAYEIFFVYVHWDVTRHPVPTGEPVSLLPLPDDVCIAFYQDGITDLGRPLRVSREAINTAVGPFPRTISPADRN